MDDRLAGLRAALDERDRLQSFASRLESLKSEGSLSAAEYSTGTADYDSRIAATTARIEALKTAIRKELEACEREADMCHLRLEGAEARHLAGELTLTQFEDERRKWNAHSRRIEEQSTALEVALAAESIAELGDEVGTFSSEPPVAPSIPAAAARPEARQAPSHIASPPTTRAWTRLRVAALGAAIILIISVRLAWIAPTELLGNDLRAEAGVSVTFLAGLGGILCGLIAIGASFIRTSRTRGTVQILAGCLALAALGAAVVLGELPLHDSYFRELVVLREGFFTYLVVAAGLAVLGFIQMRQWA